MTVYDEFRELAGELMTGDFKVEAVLIRVTGEHDPRARSRSKYEVQVRCHAVLAPRRIMTEGGLVLNQTVATVYGAKPEDGDRLSIGLSTYTVDTVEEIAPDGKTIVWKAVLR